MPGAPRPYIGLAAQASAGDEYPDVWGMTGGAVPYGAWVIAAGSITAGVSPWTANRYDGQYLVMLTGAAAGKVYYITTNTALAINVQPATLVADGVINTDRFMVGRYAVNPRANEDTYAGPATGIIAGAVQDAANPWLANDFNNRWLVPTTGAAKGKAYLITTNTAGAINVLPANLVADGVVVADAYAITGGSIVNSVGVLHPQVALPDPDTDVQEYWTVSQRERFTSARGLFKSQGSIEGPLQNPKLLAMALGKEVTTGTAVGGGLATTLTALVNAGDNLINCAAVANAAIGDYVQVGPAASAEVRRITNIVALTLTLDRPFRQNHANAVAVTEVTSPYTHTFTPDDVLPSMTFEAVLKNVTDFIRQFYGCVVSEIEVTGEVGKALMVNATILAKKQAKVTTVATITVLATVPYMWNQAALTFNSVAIARVEKWSYKGSGDVEMIAGLQNTPSGDGLYSIEPVVKKWKSTWTMTVIPHDTTLWDLLVGDSSVTGSMVFTRGANDTLTFTVTGIRPKTAPHPIPEEGALKVDLTGDGNSVSIVAVDSTQYYV